MQVTHSWMDSPHHFVFVDRLYTMYFLIVEELWPCEVINPEEWS
jgi:hypothetical protein